MAQVSASMVKELRQRTGLGMMECKKALVAVNGDIETAINELRKSGQAKAAKKAVRTAAEGIVCAKIAPNNSFAVIIEVNSETDFVARDENFIQYVNQVLDLAFANKETDLNLLMADKLETLRLALVQKLGENINVRRVLLLEGGIVDAYVHGNKRIATLVQLQGGDSETARNIAMHVAATNPMVINKDEISQDLIDKEREIFSAQAAQSGKSQAIIKKMVEGRVKKFLAENSLTDQPFVKNPDMKVSDLVKKSGASITKFIRFEVGDGIEKEAVDFAAEVKEQAGL